MALTLRQYEFQIAPALISAMSPLRHWGWEGVIMPKTILLVEDREDIRTMMAVYLTLKQYDVIQASDGREGVQKALFHKPDLILMDLAMPVLNGFDSTIEIRKHEDLADTPILCLTAFGDLYEDKAMAAGCNEVLQKPIDFGRLDEVLEQHIR